MKYFAWLLVVVNLGLLAYFTLVPMVQEAAVVNLPTLHPEKIQLVSTKELESWPKKAGGAEPAADAAATTTTADAAPANDATATPAANLPSATPPVENALLCYQWGSFSPKNLPRARNVLTKLSLQNEVKQAENTDAVRYWVYIPPKKTLEQAQSKVEELKGLGVEDLFIVQDPQWRLAISLGLFKDEALANKRLEDLKSRGVISAIKGVRNQKGQSSLLINKMSKDMVSEIQKLEPDFPGSELKQVDCQP